jgi:DNA/RNA endonuclease G (NUC1)
VTATARDPAGNSTTTAPISVTLRNGAGISVHTTFGLPGPATGDTSDSDHSLSVKSQSVVSYSGTLREPNWVAWELNSTWPGTTPRQNDFRPDTTFPASIPQVQLSDYVGSGLDRGHMCPSEDRGVLDSPGQGVASLSAATRVISVIMPNDESLILKSADWQDYRVTAGDIESHTGFTFFSDAPDTVSAALESELDTAP